MTRPAVGTLAPVIKVGGTELRADMLNSLIGLKVSSGLRLPSRLRMDFLDEGFSLSAGSMFTLGSKITVEVADGTAIFTGQLTGVELDVEAGAPYLTVIADDPAYQMTLGTKVATFAESTLSDVVTKIAQSYGLKTSVSSTPVNFPYLLQTDSDFAFLNQIADRAGFDWWVDATGTFHFHPMGDDIGASTRLSWDTGLQHFSVRASALHPTEVTVRGWDSANVKGVVAKNKPVKGTPTARLAESFVAASSLTRHSKVTSGYQVYQESADGAAMATAAATIAVTGAVTAEGVCYVNGDIVVAGKVTIADTGPASGEYSVTEVEHSYSARGFDTRFVAGDRVPTSLVDSLSTPVGSSFRQQSMVVGVVTQVGDSGEQAGMVKVKFPTLGDEVESAWGRVVSMGAGDSRGMTFLPEVNDEVIVAFEGGDVTRPLVLGGLYSSKYAALDFGVKSSKVNKRQIVSRLGHVIELGDGDGEPDQRIALTLAGGEQSVVLSKESLVAKVPSGKPVTVTAGQSKIEIDKSGNIVLSGQKITIDAQQDVEISATNIKLKSKAIMEASAAQAKISANGMAEVSSSGMTAIKGSVVKIN